jgi:hypothetical protein
MVGRTVPSGVSKRAGCARDQSEYDELNVEAKRHIDIIRRQANSEETSDE